jgi:hypothetical protein
MGKMSKRKANKRQRKTPKPKKSTTPRSPVNKARAVSHFATLLASPIGSPQPFSTDPSSSGDHNGHSTTTGLKGASQKYDDGSIVVEATEELTAVRTDGLNASLTASCRRIQRGNITAVHQINYSYKNRIISDSTLLSNVSDCDFTLQVPSGFQAWPSRQVKATQFGKNDHDDEGTGSPDMGLIQTNSEVFGGSVKISVMATIFGAEWRNNNKRLGAMIDIFYPDKKRMIRVPLVDVGPGENAPSHAEVDLTWASDQFLGTDGGATVRYRILVPS